VRGKKLFTERLSVNQKKTDKNKCPLKYPSQNAYRASLKTHFVKEKTDSATEARKAPEGVLSHSEGV